MCPVVGASGESSGHTTDLAWPSSAPNGLQEKHKSLAFHRPPLSLAAATRQPGCQRRAKVGITLPHSSPGGPASGQVPISPSSSPVTMMMRWPASLCCRELSTKVCPLHVSPAKDWKTKDPRASPKLKRKGKKDDG